MASTISSPQTMAQRWLNGMQQGGTRWAQGCQQTQANLFERALQQAPQAAANYAKAVAPGGSWQNAMNNGNVAQWKSQCAAAAAAGRFAQGGAKGQGKYMKFAQNAQPVYADMRAAAAQAQGPIAKVTAALQVLIQAGKKNGNGILAANA
jgi:hypothetical protein